MTRAYAIWAAVLIVPCASTMLLTYVPIWIGIRLGWWR